MATGFDEMIKQEPFPDPGKTTVAVVTGEHPFNVPGFHNMFRSMSEIDYYPQQLHHFVVDMGRVRTQYDVVLLYNFHQDIPPMDEHHWWWFGRTAEELKELGKVEQGIVMLHHGIYAFPQWEFWSELVGIPHLERTYALDELAGNSFCEKLRIEIMDAGHPIVRGLSAWDMYLETWGFGAVEPGPDCHVILRTDHPKMRLKAMAWTHQFRNARVFCLQSGHNNDSYVDPNFRTVLSRGIQWAAGRL
jgi:hypothetical protein